MAPSSPAIDQIDALLWRLRSPMSDEADHPLLVGVTATASREGTTTVALGLAVRAAMEASAVLLVDTDGSRHGLGNVLGLKPAAGLYEVLAGEAAFADVVRRDAQHNLDLLNAGHTRRGFHPERLASLLNEWREAYDMVVIDLPPADQLQRVLPLAQQLDGSLLVVRSESSRHKEVADACHRLNDAGVHLVGSVLNGQRDLLPRWLRRWL